MTVAYETGATSSMADFLSKLTTFAAANGFISDSVPGGFVLTDDDESIVVGLHSTTTQIQMKGAITYDSGADWNTQGGASLTLTAVMDSAGAVGPYTSYHFFCGEESGKRYFHAVLELTDGIYRHLAFGEMHKIGSYTGGNYFEGTYWHNFQFFMDQPDSTSHTIIGDANSDGNNRSHVWIDYDGKTNNIQQVVPASSINPLGIHGTVRSLGIHATLVGGGQNMKWNLRTPLYPIMSFAGRAGNLGSPIGYYPGIRFLSLRNIAAEDEITIAGDTWKCFPICQRTDIWGINSATIPSSGYYGYALLMP